MYKNNSLITMTRIIIFCIILRKMRVFGTIQSCLNRCEVTVKNDNELFIQVEDILSFQRFFEAGKVALEVGEITAINVHCTRALLAEPIQQFDKNWLPLTKRVLTLKFKGCRILRLATSAFYYFNKLTWLEINNLEDGPTFLPSPGALSGLKTLAALSLIKLRLSHVPVNLVHRDAPQLVKLFLNNNHIKTINHNSFCDMPRLSDLSLSSNRLVETNLEFVSCMETLYYLNLSDNLITRIPKSTFQENRMLHTLDLSYNKINSSYSFIEIIKNYDSIRKIYIAGNYFPCNISALKVLNDLSNRIIFGDWEYVTCYIDNRVVLVAELLSPNKYSNLLVIGLAIGSIVLGVCIVCVLISVCSSEDNMCVKKNAVTAWRYNVQRTSSFGLPEASTYNSFLQIGAEDSGKTDHLIVKDFKKHSIDDYRVRPVSSTFVKTRSNSSSHIGQNSLTIPPKCREKRASLHHIPTYNDAKNPLNSSSVDISTPPAIEPPPNKTSSAEKSSAEVDVHESSKTESRFNALDSFLLPLSWPTLSTYDSYTSSVCMNPQPNNEPLPPAISRNDKNRKKKPRRHSTFTSEKSMMTEQTTSSLTGD